MYAFKGDRIYVRDEHATTTRSATVISSDYTDGRPPFWVQWDDSGEQDLLFPGPSDEIEHVGPAYPAETEPRMVVSALVG